MNSRLRLQVRSFAFSLPDLLVVMAVIAVLAALVVPLWAKGVAKARQARCVANLKEITRAVLRYADDNQQTLPAPPPSQDRIPWFWYKEQVKGYAGLTGESSRRDKLFACPNDRGYENQGPFCWNQKFDFNSYVFNNVNLPGIPNIAGRTVASIKEPEKTLLVMEWTAHAPLSWHKSRTGKQNYPFYSDAENVVSFVDGNVQFIKIYYDGINAAYTRDPIPGYHYKYSGD